MIPRFILWAEIRVALFFNKRLSLFMILFGKVATSCFLNIRTVALASVAQWLSASLQIKGSLVQFPVRAHAWVSGQVPSRGRMRGNHPLMFPSLSPSFLSKK